MILGLIMVIGFVVLASAQVDIPEDHIGTAVDTLFTGVLDAAYAVHGVLSLTPTDSITGSDLELDGAYGITTFKSGGNTYAVVTAFFDDSVQILNVTDPSNIITTDSITEGGSLELSGAQGITTFKSGGHIYAAVTAYDDNGVQILNVTDPSNIIATDSITDGGSLELAGATSITIFKSGGNTYAAVAAFDDDGVQILNVTDPSNIIATDSITDTNTLELDTATSITTFKSGGNTYAAVTAYADNGVQILNVTDPSNIIATDSITDDNNLELDGAYGITTFKSGGNTYAAVAAFDDDGVQILNVTDPSNIIATDSITDGGSLELDGAYGITTFESGGHTYAAVTAFRDDSVQILDVTDPSNIIATDSITGSDLELDGAQGITTFKSGGNTYAAVTAYTDDGVQIIRIDITSSDTMPPILSLTGNTSVTISVGTTYNDEGAICEDNADGTIIPTVVSNTVDTTQTGTYAVTYSCTDAANNSATQVSRTVIVQTAVTPDITPPTFVSSELDTATRVLTITFSEIIDATNVDAAKIHIRESGTYTGGITLTANELVTTTNASTISFTLTMPHLETVKGLTTPELTVEPGAVRDTSGNLIVGTFDVSTASYAGDVERFSVSGQDLAPRGMAFSNDGAKMFVVGWFDKDINEYTLSTPFDVSTASYAGDVERFSVSEQDTAPQGMAFSNDGAKMFVVGWYDEDINEYTLSTPFDVSTATFDDVVFSVSEQDTAPQGMAFSNDGAKMFVIGDHENAINEYTLSTPFDVSTATFDDVVFSVSMQETVPTGMAFSNDGAKMFVIGSVGDDINEYTLSTPFDVSTATFDDVVFSVSMQETVPTGMAFSNDGAKMFVIGSVGDDINEYTLSSVYPITVTSPPAGAFVTTWRTTTADESITLPISGSDMTVDWGDGNTTTASGSVNHIYNTAGDYTIQVTGGLERFHLNNDAAYASKLVSLDQWGNSTWTTMKNAFYGADNMAYNAADSPDLSTVTDMSDMFRGASSFNGNISGWDVSSVTNMNEMFRSASDFNQPLNSWNVSSVNRMDGMFRSASDFNQPLNAWDVSSVIFMSSMFSGATSFDGNISGWDVSSVTNMNEMFWGASDFNQPLNAWDVSSVTGMSSMFIGASFFDQPLNDWDVSSVTDMTFMFQSAFDFNQPLNDWDVSSVIFMSSMFFSASSFDGNISGWDVSSVTNMNEMFFDATSFNQNLAGWYVVQDLPPVLTANATLSIRAQNSHLDGLVSTYSIDDTRFVMDGKTLSLNSTNLPPAGIYPLDITAPAVLSEPNADTHTRTVNITVSDPSAMPFATTWRTTTADESITLPISGSDMTVDWGDGNTATGVSAPVDHTYNTAGDYTVQITGGLERFHLNDAANASKLVSLDQWGNIQWESMNSAFGGATNMVYMATDTPDLSEVTDMRDMFNEASNFNGNLSTWNVSKVTDMSYMFADATSFNGTLSGWDVSSVTVIYNMFEGATSFNQDISGWNVSGVTDMDDMFKGATSFNGTLSGWNVSGVTDMDEMFKGATSFNGTLSGWDVSSVTVIYSMFEGATSFNQDISGWDVSSVTDMNSMFKGATSFNQDISGWDVSSVTVIYSMFEGATSFNQDISGWDVSSANNMESMFFGASDFNQNLGNWFIVLDSNTFAADVDVLHISTQNDYLDQAKPAYTIGDAQFVIGPDDPDITLNSSPTVPDGSYQVTITVDMPDFGSATHSLNTEIHVQVNPPLTAFVTTWRTTTADESITLPISGSDMTVDWGDGNTATASGSVNHIYNTAGDYTIQVTGGLERFHLNNDADASKLVSLDQWGNTTWTTMENAFYGADNMAYNAADSPDLSTVTDMTGMFRGASSFNGNISGWDVSSVTNMNEMFYFATSFNQTLNTWDVSSVTEMDDMFYYASVFNHPLNDWDVSSVTDMTEMFHSATSFNQPLNSWNVSSVNSMNSMFETTSFNQTLNTWDVSSVTEMNGMFNSASSFNQPLNSWNVSSVNSMNNMFNSASSFNHPLNDWDVSSVTTMFRMFSGATAFDQNLANWYVVQDPPVLTANAMFPIRAQNSYLDGLVSTYSINDTRFVMDDKTLSLNSTNLPPAGMYPLDITAPAVLGEPNAEEEGHTRTLIVTVSDPPAMPFITTWTASVSDYGITLPMVGTYSVLWGDGSNSTNVSGSQSHTYGVAGDYAVTVLGDGLEYIRLHGDNVNALQLKSIDQWGDTRWTTMDKAFYGARNMVYNATDSPDLSGVADMHRMFHAAAAFNGDLSSWDVSSVTDMSSMFRDATSFDQPLNTWDVSSVTDMHRMFDGATSFNGDLSSWDVSAVTDMSNMFIFATSFNGNLSSWDVSKVTDMSSMFDGATSFNQPLNAWDVSSVTEMDGMFYYASVFNHPLNDWDVSSVTNMNEMFRSATFFNQPLNSWDVSKVTDMSDMFIFAYDFNGNLSSWDVSSVTNMNEMFAVATSFNGNLSSWDVSAVTDMSSMFDGATSFNGDLSSWDVSAVTDMSNMFDGTTSFNGDLSSWDVSKVTDMSYMFIFATSFNGNLSSWDVSAVTDMSSMFDGTTAFNGDLSSWDVSSVTDMNNMFYYDTSFNQPLNDWDVSSVTEMDGMFFYTPSFTQNLGNWYVVANATSIARADVPGVVAEISAQNDYLNGHNPTYGISSDNDYAFFEIVNGNKINMTSVGTKSSYMVNVTASGSNVFEDGNNWRLLEIKVTGQTTDTTSPVIKLEGSSLVTITVDETYTEQGATCEDNVDADKPATVGGDTVDTSTAGQYTVTYDCTDTAGNVATQVLRTVNVQSAPDTDAPVIIITGLTNIQLTVDETYTEEGAVCDDDVDADKPATVGGDTVDTSTAGQYTVTYDCTDTAGNVATQVLRTVNVQSAPDTDAPVIIITGLTNIQLTVDETYTEQGATCEDNVDADKPATVGGDTVDTSTVGQYTVTYDCTDSSNNEATQVSRTVNVVST